MKILVTGTSGYIGVMMGSYLSQRGHDVTGLDTGYYRDGWLYDGINELPKTINKDIRHIDQKDLEGFDACIHLAELSNDPLGQFNPRITYDINHLGTIRLAEMCRAAGVQRFLYASSCSVYGLGSDDFKTEASEVNPLTVYAECKVLVERDVSKMAGADFSPTFFRNATAYGASPRIRFDVVLNNLAGLAWTTREIKLTSDGKPWRPLVHVLDICKAFACALDAPRDLVHNQVYNVGDEKENYRVSEIAQIISGVFPGCSLSMGDPVQDNRSYRVSFDKINTQLPGFQCEWSARLGAEQLYKLFEAIQMPGEVFEYRAFTRLKQLKYLIESKKIDNQLFWSPPPAAV